MNILTVVSDPDPICMHSVFESHEEDPLQIPIEFPSIQTSEMYTDFHTQNPRPFYNGHMHENKQLLHTLLVRPQQNSQNVQGIQNTKTQTVYQTMKTVVTTTIYLTATLITTILDFLHLILSSISTGIRYISPDRR